MFSFKTDACNCEVSLCCKIENSQGVIIESLMYSLFPDWEFLPSQLRR